MYSSWEMVCDELTDGRKKWHIEVGAPPKNLKDERWQKMKIETNILDIQSKEE